MRVVVLAFILSSTVRAAVTMMVMPMMAARLTKRTTASSSSGPSWETADDAASANAPGRSVVEAAYPSRIRQGRGKAVRMTEQNSISLAATRSLTYVLAMVV